MNGKRVTLYVDGMTCGSCESRIERVVSGLDGVLSVEARVRGGRVTVEYDENRVGLQSIKRAIEAEGYPIRERPAEGTAVAAAIGLLLVTAYLVAGASGLFSSIPKVDSSVGYAALFVIGLFTSVHCVAMCGGLALSQSVETPLAGSGTAPHADRLGRLRPGLLYNAGRVASYTAIGGAVGAIGAAFSFSPVAKGIIAAVAGAFMVGLALRMLGVLRLPIGFVSLIPAPLRAVGGSVVGRLRRGGPFGVGILNGLMPCGPLQTMQLYALGTGSAVAGAISMLIFSAGTVPLMLLFGLTATLLPRKFVPTMVKASAVLVMFLGAVTFARAATLAGIPLPRLAVSEPPYAATSATKPIGNAAKGALAGLAKATVSNGKQTIRTDFTGGSYVPFAVQAGIPLVWTVRISAKDLNGCNDELVIPEYGVRKKLGAGDNVIEFTPTRAGMIAYSCWMGMIRSSITVAESLDEAIPLAGPIDDPRAALPGKTCCATR